MIDPTIFDKEDTCGSPFTLLYTEPFLDKKRLL